MTDDCTIRPAHTFNQRGVCLICGAVDAFYESDELLADVVKAGSKSRYPVTTTTHMTLLEFAREYGVRRVVPAVWGIPPGTEGVQPAASLTDAQHIVSEHPRGTAVVVVRTVGEWAEVS